MIPQEKSEAVSRALRKAFGVTAFEDIREMTRGNTPALVYRIVVDGSPYLLRIIRYPAGAIGPERHFTCMKAASDAGLAPRVVYTSIEDAISITHFVREVPFSAVEALIRMPATLRALHALPPFPEQIAHINTTCTFLLNRNPAVSAFLQGFQKAGILPAAETAVLLGGLEQIVAAYPWCEHGNMVSSHNDLFKPDNILFDGEGVWLVDWEAAFLNDRYADLAVVANMLVTSEAEQSAFLTGYFGQAPTKYQSARLFVMRQLAHIFYTMGFLFIATRGKGAEGKALDLSGESEGFESFRRRMWDGEINLAEREMKIAYGLANRERALGNLQGGQFSEALKVLAGQG